MKVLLVNSFPVQVVVDKAEPLNLCYMAAFLREKGYQTELFHMLDYKKRQIRYFMEELVPRFEIIGFSTYTANFRSAKWLAKRIKERYPYKYVVFGGPLITVEPELLRDSGADFGICGEGELTLLELIEKLKSNSKNFSEIKGLIYLEGDTVKVNPPRPRIADLDALPFAYREGLPYEKYKFMTSSAFLLGTPSFEYGIYSSRGCVNACKYCASPKIWRREWHARSAESVVAEIRYLFERFGAKVIGFPDADFCVDRERTIKFCELMKSSGLNIKWFCQSSPSHLDKKLVKLMSESGCGGFVSIGIETGASEIMDKILKTQFNLEETLELVKYIGELGMSCLVDFIIGLPWESKETLRATRSILKRLDTDIAWFSFARPYPGTVLEKIALMNGWIKEKSSDQISFMTFPSLPTFHLTKWQVYKGFWSCAFAFYFSRKFLRHLKARLKKQPIKGNLLIFARLIWGIGDTAKVFFKGLIWDAKRVIAKLLGKDPLEYWLK